MLAAAGGPAARLLLVLAAVQDRHLVAALVQPLDDDRPRRARPADHQSAQDRDGVDQAQWAEVAQQVLQTEGRRLPIECEWQAQHAVGVPQRKMTAMDLSPRQRLPWNEQKDLVKRLLITVHGGTGMLEDAI